MICGGLQHECIYSSSNPLYITVNSNAFFVVVGYNRSIYKTVMFIYVQLFIKNIFPTYFFHLVGCMLAYEYIGGRIFGGDLAKNIQAISGLDQDMAHILIEVL